MAVSKTKSISQQFGKGKQSIEFEEILKVGDNKIKIFIKSDSYAFQSKAVVYLWNKKWELIESIHHSIMKTPPSLHYHPKNISDKLSESQLKVNNEKYFREDRKRLLKVAEEILI